MSSSTEPHTLERLWALAGAAVFALGLGYFLFTYIVTFATPAATAAGPGAIAWNAALFALFAAHHSIFARAPIRATVARLVPAGLERTVYVLVASALLFAVCVSWRRLPGYAWQVGPPISWILRAGLVGGLVLTVWSASIVGIRNLSGLLPPSSGNVAFKVAGPYGWVRHPIYAGWLLLVFSTPAMTATRFEFAVISSGYLLLAIPWEERSLLQSAGQAYEPYRERVKWRVVPSVS